MGFLERLEAEFPALKRAGIILSALAIGFGGGLWFRADQVTTAKNEAASARSLVTLRDAEIATLRELKLKAETVEKVPADEGESGKSEGAAPSAPKSWPSDPDTEIVETSKPKEAPAGWKTMPTPNN